MAVSAAAPGSVTTLFVPRGDDPSLGVSLAIADGASVSVEPADDTVVYLDGQRAEVAPVSGVLRRLGAGAVVRIETDVPIGCGFGVSGAATLATALAINEAAALGRERDALVKASHRAEVEAGTGLGDVFIQNQGGLVWDRGDGLRRASSTARIGYTAFGGISTTEVLGDDTALRRVDTVGREVLARLDPGQGLGPLFESSWEFARRSGLVPSRVERVVAEVAGAGGAATMAMIGETILGVGAGEVLDHATRVTSSGATLL